MTNNISSSPSLSRLIRLGLFLASLGAVVVIYVLRRRPVQQQTFEAPLSALNPVAIITEPAVEESASETIHKNAPIKVSYQSAALILTFVYGTLLIILQNIDPRLVSGLIVATVIFAISTFLWKKGLTRTVFFRIPLDVIALPIRFYGAGQSAPTAPENGTAASWIVSVICLLGVVIALFVSSTLPLLALGIILALMLTATYAWLTSLDVLILERRFLTALKVVPAPDVVALPRASRWLLLAEMAVILLTMLFTTQPFYESPASWQFSGNEGEWLTNTIYAASTGLHEYGRIPRWQPYVAYGEPTIENPFNFIFNPVTSIPSFVLGPVTGLRLSVILSYFLAGLGGWFLGRVLGFGSLARILLAMILMGKGNIHTALNSSYFQLALSQIYMPWVIGGVIAVVRFPQRRWPMVLTALTITLQLFNGNLWYVLPTAVGAFCMALVCVFGLSKGQINWQAMRRYIVTGVMAAGLSAIIALPIVLQFNRVGRHEGEVEAGWVAPLSDIVPLFFDPNRNRTVTFFEPAFGRTSFHYVNDLDEFYFSYIIPGWYVLLIFVVLPFYRPFGRRERMIGLVVVVLFAFATLWGAGGKQPMLWLYENLAPLKQWRFVPRALAVASFWLAVLVAMRLDHLWKSIQTVDWAGLFRVKMPIRLTRAIPILLAAILVVTTGFAAADVNAQWNQYEGIIRKIEPSRNTCTTWLRQQFPDAPLSVWQQNYLDITTFLNNRVRSWNITAAFEMLPDMPSIGPDWLNLNDVVPAFGEFDNQNQRLWGRDNGYWAMLDSPKWEDGKPCLFRHVGPTLPYAYSIPLVYLNTIKEPVYGSFKPLDVSPFAPIRLVERRDDQIALIVTAHRRTPLVVGVQETAYPGWRVEVDGQPAKIESVGRQVGVVVPAGEKPVQVYFVYDPIQPIIGGIITLVTALLCILYLLTSRWDWSRLLASVKKPPVTL